MKLKTLMADKKLFITIADIAEAQKEGKVLLGRMATGTDVEIVALQEEARAILEKWKKLEEK